MSKTQQAIVATLRNVPEARIVWSGFGSDGHWALFAGLKVTTVRDATFQALIKAKAIKRHGTVWDRTWIAA